MAASAPAPSALTGSTHTATTKATPSSTTPPQKTPWTRIHEHKHFTPWETLERTVAFREYSKETEPADIPYYPKRLAPDLALHRTYEQKLAETPNITAIGRLGTYRYLDMDQVIGEALDLASDTTTAVLKKKPIPQHPRQRQK